MCVKVLLSRDSCGGQCHGNAANQTHKSTSGTYPGSWMMLGGGSGGSPRGWDVQLVATGARGYFQILCSVDLVFACSTFQWLQNVAVALKHNNSPGTQQSRVGHVLFRSLSTPELHQV